MVPRSWLLVPGDDEGKIAEALESGADALVFDLEDSVATPRKEAARAALKAALSERSADGPQRWVRINQLESAFYGEDLACCQELDIDGLVLPKAELGDQVARLGSDVFEAGWKIHAIVSETAASLFQLHTFAGCSPLLTTMSWGIDDLSTALGASSKFDADGTLSFTYRLARSLCLASARAAGVQPVDCVFRDVNAPDRLKAEAEAARREGFTGKLAIDPSQIAIINAAFTPTEDEVSAARAIVDAFEAHPNSGVLNVAGRVIDRPRLMQARGVLDRAGGT